MNTIGTQQSSRSVGATGIVTRPVLRYFVSYARADAELTEDLLNRLQLRLRLSKEYEFEPWQDSGILPGEAWATEIAEALDACDFGLLLVSYEFLLSRFIGQYELPRFVGPEADRRAFPVGLQKVRFDGALDLKGLEKIQVFRDAQGRFYDELTGDRARNLFADRLFDQILRVARKHLGPVRTPQVRTTP